MDLVVALAVALPFSIFDSLSSQLSNLILAFEVDTAATALGFLTRLTLPVQFTQTPIYHLQ